jgi:hypothetical protein
VNRSKNKKLCYTKLKAIVAGIQLKAGARTGVCSSKDRNRIMRI